MEPVPVLLFGCLAGLVLALSGLYAPVRRKPASSAPKSGAPERSLRELRPGDVVQRGGTFLTVRSALQLESAGRWQALYELEADGAPLLSLLLVAAEGAEGIDDEAVWLLGAQAEPDADLLGTAHAPATESLAHDGLRYRLVSRHHTTARPVTQGPGPARAGGQSLSLACYRGPGAERLVVTRWLAAPSARLYAGELVSSESLSILAGS